MIPAGYTAKQTAARPEWLAAEGVVEICSVSDCVSQAFCDYTAHWRHNGFGLLNSPADIRDIARTLGVDLNGHTLFYYEVHVQQYDDSDQTWKPFAPMAGLEVAVQPPQAAELRGFDVVSFSAQSSHECSPLSCNSLAQFIPVNAHCLLSSFEEAQTLLEQGRFVQCEPGPYRIYAVYVCDVF